MIIIAYKRLAELEGATIRNSLPRKMPVILVNLHGSFKCLWNVRLFVSSFSSATGISHNVMLPVCVLSSIEPTSSRRFGLVFILWCPYCQRTHWSYSTPGWIYQLLALARLNPLSSLDQSVLADCQNVAADCPSCCKPIHLTVCHLHAVSIDWFIMAEHRDTAKWG